MREQEIYIEAMKRHKPADRHRFLDEACGDNRALRERLDLLIRHSEEVESFLESSPVEYLAPPTIDHPITEKPGTQIGPYKLLQQLGEGGMGVVYMAEQKEPVKRRVALKIIKPGMDTRQVIARFEAERQALAMMDHPNIAKVLDAGQTESGRPYFVMELVNGLPVTKYCDEQHLTPKERLELFVPICQAVQHAHQKGIIHRDLKPSNILVAMYDNKAVPKIIDFGVAKATSQTLTEKTMFTQLGQVVGTLEYMSPEQAQRNQLDIDTRSDIYSLGVVLYELLTGETPFDRERLRSAAFDEMLRIIREEEPSKPSTKVSSSQSLPSIATNRRIEPAKLGSMIRGELDWIVLKAMEKDRGRRYETASKFAEDVQHYLNDEAVVACPPSASYRFRKFARRNKAVLGTAGVVAASLILGIMGISWQAYVASKERDRAVIAEEVAEERLAIVESQREELEEEKAKAIEAARRADKEADIAKQSLVISSSLNDFFTKDVLGMASVQHQVEAGKYANPDMSLHEVLDHAAARVGVRFSAQPSVEAAICFALGDTFLTIGDAAKAEELLRRAQVLQQNMLDPKIARIVKSTGNVKNDLCLSMTARGLALAKLGKANEAEAQIKEALELHKESFGSDAPQIGHELTRIKILSNWARVLDQLGNADCVLEVCSEALAVCRDAHLERSQWAGDLHRLAGNALSDLNRYSESEHHLRQALEIYDQSFGPTHPSTSQCMARVGVALHLQERYEEAVVMLQRAYEMRMSSLAPEYSKDTQVMATKLAFALEKLKQNTKAIKILEEALEATVYGPNSGHAFSAEFVAKLVWDLRDEGRLQEAEQVLDRFFEASDSRRNRGDVNFGKLLMVAAQFYQERGNNQRAYECSRLAYDTIRLIEGPESQAAKLAQQQLSAYSSLFAFELAETPDSKGQDPEKILELAKSGREHSVGTDNFGPSHLYLGLAYYRNHRWKEAVDAFEEATRLSGRKFENFGFYRAMAYWQAGNQNKALEEYEQAVDWMESVGSPEQQIKIRAEAGRVIPQDAIDGFYQQKTKKPASDESEITSTDGT